MRKSWNGSSSASSSAGSGARSVGHMLYLLTTWGSRKLERGPMRQGVFAPLRVVNYRWLWIGQFVSMIGDKINQIAMAMMVYAVTGSMLHMGFMLGVTLLPAALFGLLAGVYVDRWDRRMTMIGADLIRAVLVGLIPVVARFGIGWVYAIAFVVSSVSLFFIPAKRAIIPDLVPGDELMAANSLDDASEAVAEFAGLAVGAALVALLGYATAFAVDAVSFVFSAVMIARISLPHVRAAAETAASSVWAEAAEGLRYIARSDVLRNLIGVYASAAVFAAGAIALCYALALQRYSAGAPGVALLDAAMTAGTILGALAVGRSKAGNAGRKFLIGIACVGLALSAVAFAQTIWVAVPLLALAGVANMWFVIPATTILQTRSEDSVRGRVMAASTSVNRIAMVAGVIAIGALAEAVPIAWVTAGIGVGAMLVALVGSLQVPLREA
jgi:DHA3 family macrolide efflux protein-like MFS transporter